MSTIKSSTSKENYDYPEMGARIRTIRGALSQAKLAEIIGVSQGTIGKYEKGMMPSSDSLLRIAEYGGKSANWIRNGIEDIKPMSIAEITSSYSPEAKTIAQTIEMIIEGKTEEERREMVKNIMADIWKKYS